GEQRVEVERRVRRRAVRTVAHRFTGCRHAASLRARPADASHLRRAARLLLVVLGVLPECGRRRLAIGWPRCADACEMIDREGVLPTGNPWVRCLSWSDNSRPGAAGTARAAAPR